MLKTLNLTSILFAVILINIPPSKAKPQLNHNWWTPEKIQTKTTRIIREQPHVQAISVDDNANSSINNEIPIVNSEIILSKYFKRVELICSAKHPIKWEFMVNGVSIPILEVQYKRTFHRSDLGDEIHLNDQNLNSFEGRVMLRGPLESQSGKYSCRFYNGRFTNNSYVNSVHLNVFVPGERVFTSVSHIQYINDSDNSVVISCPISNPEMNVALQKLNEDVFNKTNKLKWEQVFAQFNPSLGFELRKVVQFRPQLFGTYKCVALGSSASITVHIADSTWKEKVYDPLLENQQSCWDSSVCMKMIRSKRLECFCKDSYALFVNHNGTESNKRGNCSDLETIIQNLSNLTNNDWRVEEFLRNGEAEPNICFRDEIRGPLNGTGARILLRTSKMVEGLLLGNGSSPPSASSSLVNFTITLYGFPEWASGFQIGIEYNNYSSRDDNIQRETKQGKRISLLDQEPTTQLFPLAHYQAVWRNVIIDTSQVSRIHVFQPDSFSFQWFQISSSVADATSMSPTQTQVNIDGRDKVCGESWDWILIVFLALTGLSILFIILYAVIYLRRQRLPRLVKYYKCGIERSSRCFVNPDE